jgi:hypothetical protein
MMEAGIRNFLFRRGNTGNRFADIINADFMVFHPANPSQIIFTRI